MIVKEERTFVKEVRVMKCDICKKDIDDYEDGGKLQFHLIMGDKNRKKYDNLGHYHFKCLYDHLKKLWR